MEMIGPTAPKGKGPAVRSKKGCDVCRNRKKKCDEQHPTCGACQRNGFECTWPGDWPQRRRARRRQLRPDASLPPELAAMVTVFAVPSPALVRRLLSHFTDHSPIWLSARVGCNGARILSQLLPEAMESPLILNCVLTIAASDLMKYDTADLGLQGAAVEYYGQASSGLREGLRQDEAVGPVSDHSTLAVLLFCLHEAQNFSSSHRILPHLNAAVALLYPRLHTTPPNSELRAFLFELFCYFFSITAFTHGSSLALHQASQIFESEPLLQYLQRGTVMGTSHKVFLVIYRLSVRLSQLPPGVVSDIPMQTELIAAEYRLVHWSMQCLENMDEGSRNDALTSELWRLACLIFVKKTLDPYIPDHSRTIQTLVATFIQTLDLLPADYPSNGFMTWPLMMAGLCAVVRGHQLAIATRFRKTYDLWRSDIFASSCEFLRGVWGQKREGVAGLGLNGLHALQYPAILL